MLFTVMINRSTSVLHLGKHPNLPLARLCRSDEGPSVGYAPKTELAQSGSTVRVRDVIGPDRTLAPWSSAAARLH